MKQKEDDHTKEPTIANSDTFLNEKLTLDSLGYAFHTGNRPDIKKYWGNVLQNRKKILDFLFTLKGNKNSSGWYWTDLKASKLRIREYHIPNFEDAALFLICAIHYEDIAFASSRYMYYNDILNINLKGEFKNEDFASQNIDMIKLWDATVNWYKSGSKNRPFGNLPIYWPGETGGKISRENIVKSKWYFRG
ncbi:MAG: hypothetical protein V4556_00100 [Bacteroidota bacterium]